MTLDQVPASDYSVVIPTLGRAGLGVVLRGLACQEGSAPTEVVVVDDRPDPTSDLALPTGTQELSVRVVPGFGRGPAAARNLGWRLTSSDWVAFLDDDVELLPGWAEDLAHDLASVEDTVGASQGRIVVPLPDGRRPTDWERSTAGLEEARWATADMAYRREALVAVHGFDERFPRAYREDADLALRVRRAGWTLVRGRRAVHHPVRPEDGRVSLRAQRGNADDALMRRLHGAAWRQEAQTGRGRLAVHAATTALLLLGLGGGAGPGAAAALTARTRSASAGGGGRPGHDAGIVTVLGAAAMIGWAALTTDFALRRIVPGPRDRSEVTRMATTSVLIPPLAVWHRVRGWWHHRSEGPWPPAPRAVLFDRDGTLVHDLPDNDDPTLVRPCAGAREALDRLRGAGLPLGVVTNQAAVAAGRLTPEAVECVNAEVEDRLGPFGTWQVCVHHEEAGCPCRKPRPGMVRDAARALGVRPESCIVVGDIGSDVLAARAAGATGLLVPTPVTRPEEIADAPWTAPDITAAVDLIVGWRRG